MSQRPNHGINWSALRWTVGAFVVLFSLIAGVALTTMYHLSSQGAQIWDEPEHIIGLVVLGLGFGLPIISTLGCFLYGVIDDNQQNEFKVKK